MPKKTMQNSSPLPEDQPESSKDAVLSASDISRNQENVVQENKKKYFSVLRIKDASMVLRTSTARYYFFKGGGGKGAVSVLHFAKQVREIWRAAEQDDPYADLFLLRIYDALTNTRRDIRQTIKYYRDYLAKEVSFDWDLQLSKAGEPVRLYFNSSYGYMAANLIADLDELVCLLYATKKLGVMLDKPIAELIAESTNKIKTVLQWPQQWRKTEITREDVRQQNEKAKQAKIFMGDIHEQILSGKLRSPYAPFKKSKTSPTT